MRHGAGRHRALKCAGTECGVAGAGMWRAVDELEFEKLAVGGNSMDPGESARLKEQRDALRDKIQVMEVADELEETIRRKGETCVRGAGGGRAARRGFQ